MCLEEDFLREFNNQDKKNKYRDEQIIDIDDKNVDDDVLLQLPSFCVEGITTTEHKEEGDIRNLSNIFGNDRSSIISHQVYQLRTIVEIIVVL